MVIECNNPVVKKDKFIQDKMFTELEYIVSLAIKELQKVIKNDYEFIIPTTMQKATNTYKTTNNSFLSFMEECTVERSGGKIYDSCNTKRFFDVYVAWCKDNNRGYYEPKKDIKRLLEKLKKDETKKINGSHYYSNFTLNGETKKDYSMIYGNDMRVTG